MLLNIADNDLVASSETRVGTKGGIGHSHRKRVGMRVGDDVIAAQFLQ